MKTICECALNTVRGNVDLTKTEKRRLKKHKQLLRRLASDRGGLKSKRRIIIQHGSGFLPMLIAPILGSLFSRWFGN